MWESIQPYFSGPLLIPSVLLGLISLYWLFVILGALDIELFDFDFDAELGVEDGSVFDLGLMSLRFLNLGDVPLMIWASVFSFTFWLAAVLATDYADPQAAVSDWVVVLGSSLLAVFATKVLTIPLRGKFSAEPPNPVEKLIGRTCVITAETTEKHGQAELTTDATPLLLNVRTHEGTLAKGTMVRIVDFEQEKSLYYVSNSDLEE